MSKVIEKKNSKKNKSDKKNDKPIKEIKYITKDKLLKTDLLSSTIEECIIEKNNGDIISDKKKYKLLLIDIFKNMPVQKVLQNTNFNLHLADKKGDKVYNYNNDLNISIQSKNANETIKEIINMLDYNKYKMTIKIKLDNNKMIYYKT